MFCTNCGENLVDGILFCPKCGAKIGINNNPMPSQQTTIGAWIAIGFGAIGILFHLVRTIYYLSSNDPIYGIPLAGVFSIPFIFSIIFSFGGYLLLRPKIKPSMQNGLWIGFAVSLLFIILAPAIVFGGLVPPIAILLLLFALKAGKMKHNASKE